MCVQHAFSRRGCTRSLLPQLRASMCPKRERTEVQRQLEKTNRNSHHRLLSAQRAAQINKHFIKWFLAQNRILMHLVSTVQPWQIRARIQANIVEHTEAMPTSSEILVIFGCQYTREHATSRMNLLRSRILPAKDLRL